MDKLNASYIVLLGILIVVTLICAVSPPFFTVGQNEATVVTRFGQMVYVADPGLHFKLPIVNSTVTYRTDIQELRNQKPANTYTIDNQEVDIIYTVFYRTPKNRVGYVFANNPDYNSRLQSMIVDRMKAAFGKVNVQKIAENRGELRDAIKKTLKDDAEPLGVEITDVQLTNLDYNESFRNAVNQAAVQKANIEAVEYQRQQAQKKAEMAVIEAEGAASAVRARAKGDADAALFAAEAKAKGTRLQGEAEAAAIKAQAEALAANPRLVDLRKAERWDGALPRSMLSNVVPFMNVDQQTSLPSAGKQP